MGDSQLTTLKAGVLQALAAAWQGPGAGPYPLSSAQESLWFIEQMAPATPTYNLPEAWLLEGRLDIAALQQSLDEIASRHELLRTSIQAQDGQPKQFVLSSVRIALEVVDLSGSEFSQTELSSRLQTEAQRPFDLSCAPLVRAVLFRRAANAHTLLLNFHHIVSDAWSQRVFMQELALCYEAFAGARRPCLPALPIQYADFALWQGELLESEAGRADLDYWQKQLRPPFKLLQLASDHPRQAVRSYRGATRFFELSRELTEALKGLSRRQGVTLFMTLLAAFKTLLYRSTQEHDIIVGSPMAGRERAEVEGLIGLFVNTHALRSDLSGDPSFLELLARIREVVLGAYAHQELPCEVVLQGLHTSRAGTGHPLFEVVFGWQGTQVECLKLGGVEATRTELETGTAKFEWTVLASEGQDGSLRLRSEFSTDRFEPATMTGLMRQYLTLLEGVVSSPQHRISRLPLISEAERQKLLVEHNQVASDYERDRCIHELFEEQTRRAPDSVALSFEEREMTYGALNSAANQLARHLQACGVTRGARVGLCLERSCEMVIGLLAILKAGGAYVPLDRSYPMERLAFMLRDCGCSLLVTDADWPADAAARAGLSHVISLDREQPRLDQLSRENLQTPVEPTDLAYVLYTSGSTGTPKGVPVPHRAVLRLVRNTNYLEFSRELVFLQLAPISFDASTFELWGALLNGGRLVIFPPKIPSLAELGRVIRENRVTTLWLTAGLFHQMIDHELESLRGLKHLLAGGDVLSPAHVAKASCQLCGCQIINGYGPTENTTFTCCFRIPEGWPEERSVPIGRPISNTRVYVLDGHQVPVPVGMPGELYASGDGLADGYLNQPELTRTKFVPNPFPGDPCPRLYRTGDRVRWLPDGTLEFLGRTDAQVKIRGYRVEPGEVETALVGHPAVETAAVVARKDNSGTNQLFGYVVPRPGQPVAGGELREFLASRLAPYMVPVRIRSLDRLPLTPNGKVDREALPDPGLEALPDSLPQVAPRNPLEETLASIWREVLGRAGLGVHEDFFQLGGHSLLATQVISRVSKRCQVDLPVVAIFEAPTIARLALAIETTRGKRPTGGPSTLIQSSGPAHAAELLARLDDLSEAEVDELLRKPEFDL